MTVSFVIPNWNRSGLLAAALASIRGQTYPALEILVVDNGSSDDSGQIALRAGARLLQMETNRGFSFAVNRGVEAARGDAIAVVNNDVEFRQDWTERLVRALSQNGGWFAIGKLLDYTRRDYIDGVGDAICRGGTACRLGHGRADGKWFNQPRRTFFPSATAVLARREFFARVGPLEEAFFSYLEDVDLGLRAALLGLEGLYVPDAVAYHRGSSTLGAWSGKNVEWMTRNQILLLAKYYPARLLRLFWRPVLAAQVLWAAMTFSRWHGLAYAHGLVAGLVRCWKVRKASAWLRGDGNRLAEVLLASEGELESFERSSGWDRYWTWYFRLAPRPRETQS